MFNSMYKYSCLSIYAEAWLWYWGECLSYAKVSIPLPLIFLHGTIVPPVLGDKKECENANI